ncbi:MAG: DNA internalization-related competence protein ComEC/Rec2 [Thauera sp.]|nr:DNA internalization-related competence protein ComEC/Rec2 [Thauera sp.]
MRVLLVLFACGVWSFQQQPALVPHPWLTGGWCLLTLCAAIAFRWRHRARGGQGVAPPCIRANWRWRLVLAVAVFGAGFLWAAQRAEWRLGDELAMGLEGDDLTLTGRIAELPQQLDEGVRFTFAPDGESASIPRRIQVSWYRPREAGAEVLKVRAGERWRFVLRLKRPHGFVNPDGFDYEAWLLERELRATGYVRGGARLLDDEPRTFLHRVDRVRGDIRSRFEGALGDAPYAGVLIALVIGDQRAIPVAQWETFRRAGLTHLIAISGMHISLVSLLAGSLLGLVWRRVPALLLRVPVRKAAALAALVAGTAYALLAGMGIPVQRALIMLAVIALAMLAGRSLAPSRVLLLALGGVLLADPWAVLAAGFWLSFAAVGVILFVLGGRHGMRRGRGGWRAAVVTQLGITLATLPLLVALFQSFSVVSPIANALAIPVVSLLVTPLALLAAAVPLDFLLLLAHWLMETLMYAIDWLAGFDFALWRQAAPPAWLVLAGCIAAVVALLPRGMPARAAAISVFIGLLSWQPARPGEGAFAATVLDVGQGLSVHLQTRSHDLLFDAGPPYGDVADAGQRVVLPYLAASGVGVLHRLVLSHDDADHVGGAHSVLNGLKVASVLAGEDDRGGLWRAAIDEATAVTSCTAGQHWTWDGVRFEVLHPAPAGRRARRNNDQSCVLRVVAEGGSLLLVGDLEARGEAGLLARYGAEALASSVVVVGHHGSRSSSSPAFVDAVLPEAAVHSAGYRNRFGHPDPAVWARWTQAGARNWRTDSQGAIGIRVDTDGVRVEAERQQRPRYWHGH